MKYKGTDQPLPIVAGTPLLALATFKKSTNPSQNFEFLGFKNYFL